MVTSNNRWQVELHDCLHLCCCRLQHHKRHCPDLYRNAWCLSASERQRGDQSSGSWDMQADPSDGDRMLKSFRNLVTTVTQVPDSSRHKTVSRLPLAMSFIVWGECPRLAGWYYYPSLGLQINGGQSIKRVAKMVTSRLSENLPAHHKPRNPTDDIYPANPTAFYASWIPIGFRIQDPETPLFSSGCRSRTGRFMVDPWRASSVSVRSWCKLQRWPACLGAPRPVALAMFTKIEQLCWTSNKSD